MTFEQDVRGKKGYPTTALGRKLLGRGKNQHKPLRSGQRGREWESPHGSGVWSSTHQAASCPPGDSVGTSDIVSECVLIKAQPCKGRQCHRSMGVSVPTTTTTSGPRLKGMVKSSSGLSVNVHSVQTMPTTALSPDVYGLKTTPLQRLHL